MHCFGAIWKNYILLPAILASLITSSLNIWIISREIRPLAASYPPPPTKKCFIGLRSQALRYAHAYGICAP